MTHDPIPKTLLRPTDYRLWCRNASNPWHWTMAAVGDLDDVEHVFADYGIHFPDDERLILPAAETPCGQPAKCDLCWRAAEARGRATGSGKLVLLCGRCLNRATKR